MHSKIFYQPYVFHVDTLCSSVNKNTIKLVLFKQNIKFLILKCWKNTAFEATNWCLSTLLRAIAFDAGALIEQRSMKLITCTSLPFNVRIPRDYRNVWSYIDVNLTVYDLCLYLFLIKPPYILEYLLILLTF